MKNEPLPSRSAIFRVHPIARIPQGFACTGESIAFHEAGHVVVAHAVGLPAVAATVSENRGATALTTDQPLAVPSGSVDTDYQAAFMLLAANVAIPCCAEQDRALAVCTMLAAGVQAELLHAGLSADGVMHLDDRDTREACAILRMTFGTTTPLGWCQATAKAHLTRHWERVEGIAADLITHGVWGKARTGAADPVAAALA